MALIIFGFLILLFGLIAFLNDHPNQGREVGLSYLKMAGFVMGTGTVMSALPHWWKQTRHDREE